LSADWIGFPRNDIDLEQTHQRKWSAQKTFFLQTFQKKITPSKKSHAFYSTWENCCKERNIFRRKIVLSKVHVCDLKEIFERQTKKGKKEVKVTANGIQRNSEIF
jgi:hypothetical protein